jgi:hypothetical protein
MTTTVTAINTRKDCRALATLLEAFAKRSKYISDVKADFFYEYVRIDVRATKTNSKVYNEMVELLNTILPDHYEDEGEYPCSWWHSYDTTLIDPYTDGKWEIELCVRHW